MKLSEVEILGIIWKSLTFHSGRFHSVENILRSAKCIDFWHPFMSADVANDMPTCSVELYCTQHSK